MNTFCHLFSNKFLLWQMELCPVAFQLQPLKMYLTGLWRHTNASPVDFSLFLYQFLPFQLHIIHLLTQTVFLIGLKLDLTLNQMDRGDKQKKQ